MPQGIKKSNEYQKMISREMYEKTPKAVFAAIAISYLFNHQSVNIENLELDLLHEWRLLNEQDIIPQKPYK